MAERRVRRRLHFPYMDLNLGTRGVPILGLMRKPLFLLALLALAGAILVALEAWAPVPAGPPVPVELRRAGLVLVGACLGLVVTGTFATAAGPHAGGAGTGDVVGRLDVWGATTLKTLIYVHGHMATALGVCSVLLWLFAWRRGASRTLMRALTAVCLLMALQGIVGLVQYHNALPAEVVWVHASLPAVMWVVLVWSWAAAGRPEVSDARPASDRARRSTRVRPPRDHAPGRPARPRGTAG